MSILRLLDEAQALNGILLPVVAIFLFIAVNERRMMGVKGVNGWLANLLGIGVVGVALVLGLSGLAKAVVKISGAEALSEIVRRYGGGRR